MSPEVDTNEQFSDQQPRCEIAKIHIAEGECQSLGEVQLDGSVQTDSRNRRHMAVTALSRNTVQRSR